VGNLVYARIKTNRCTLMRHIEKFRRDKTELESLLAPRPPAGRFQAFYYALVKLEYDSTLHSYFAKLGKLELIDQKNYQAEIETIMHYWSA